MTEQTKVTVPADVARAIEKLRSIGRTNYRIVSGALDSPAFLEHYTIRKWAVEGAGSPDLLMSSLINGFEIEQTSEDKLREYYDKIKRNIDSSIQLCMMPEREYSYGERCGVKKTLGILGIKIEGINA